MFLDMSIHDFDMVRFQIGEVDEIYAIGSVLVAPYLKDIGDVDVDIISLRFANGAVGAIDNSRKCVYGYDQRLEVFCSNGTAMAGNEYENMAVRGDDAGYRRRILLCKNHGIA
jgi:myo-inositol 2-dehydrogenase/D-chiro-inositol 1-dehydrogenase